MGRYLLIFLALQSLSYSEDVTTFKALWDGYRTEIATARIDYTVTRMQIKPTTLEDLKQRLEQVNLNQHEGLFERFLAEFSLRWDGKRKAWIDSTLMVDGNNVKSTGDYYNHLKVRKLHLVFDNRAKSVTGYNRGECQLAVIDVASFRDVPNQSYVENKVPMKEVGPLLRMETETGHWMTVDPLDGLPREHLVTLNGSTRPYRYRQYSQHAIYPGGIIMPAVRIDAHYEEEGISHVELRVVRDAEFNMEVNESEFVIGLEKGTNWFDNRSYFTGGQVFEPVRDAIEYYEVTEVPQAPPVNSEDVRIEEQSSFLFSWQGFLLILNGIALIALGVHFWHRQPAT